MSERPDLFVNKKSSLTEIIEVRIDATMPVFWTRGEHGSEHTRNRIEVPIDIAPNLLEQARQRAVAESLEAIFEEGMQNSCPIPSRSMYRAIWPKSPAIHVARIAYLSWSKLELIA